MSKPTSNQLTQAAGEIVANPFRVLGLAITASPREIARACEEVCQAVWVGQRPSGDDYLAWASPLDITQEVAERARYFLQDPAKRRIYEFFWFCFGYEASQRVRRLLASGDARTACAVLDRQMESSNSDDVEAAAHDLGLLRLIIAHTSTDDSEATDQFGKAIGLLLSSARSSLADDELMTLVESTLFNGIARRVRTLVSEGELESAIKIYRVLTDCPHESAPLWAACSIPFRDYLHKLDSLCTAFHVNIQSCLDNDENNDEDNDDSWKVEANIQLTACRYEDEVLEPIEQLCINSTFYEDDIVPVCDTVISTGCEISVKLNNVLSNYKAAHSILERIVRLPGSESRQQKAREGLRTIRANLFNSVYETATVLEEHNDWSGAAAQYRKALKLCEDPERRPAIEAGLERCQRILLLGGELDTYTKEPPLSTFNGIGCTFYGATDSSPDGWYVTTHWFVVAFVPFLATGRYLVRKAPTGGYYIRGRLPLLKWQKTWNWAIPSLILFLIVFGIIASDTAGSYSPSDDVNGSGKTPITSNSLPPVSQREALEKSIKDADQKLSIWETEIVSWQRKMEEKEATLQILIARKKVVESAARAGEDYDRRHYRALISQGNQLISRYNYCRSKHNEAVDQYNAVVKKRNADIVRLRTMNGG